jgi:hypothetical protein
LMLTMKKVFDFGKVYGRFLNCPRISGKIGFTRLKINNRFFER